MIGITVLGRITPAGTYIWYLDISYNNLQNVGFSLSAIELTRQI
jgi:hypothetical protein